MAAAAAARATAAAYTTAAEGTTAAARTTTPASTAFARATALAADRVPLAHPSHQAHVPPSGLSALGFLATCRDTLVQDSLTIDTTSSPLSL